MMQFVTKENVYFMSFLSCITVWNVINNLQIRSVVVFSLTALSAIALLGAFLGRYVLTVNNDTISYHMRLLGWIIYKRSFSAEQIAALHFRRAGFFDKCVRIIPHEGRKLTLRMYKGKAWLQELEQFAERNGVDIDKSDDYRFVER